MRRKDDFVMQEVAGECLLVPVGSQVLDTNGLLTLNATARFVWDLLHQDCSVDGLGAAVAEKFDVDYDRALGDVSTFLDEIRQFGLLTE